MSSSLINQHKDYLKQTGSQKFDHNQNPLNDSYSPGDDQKENGISYVNRISLSKDPMNKNFKQNRKFNESIHSLNLWMWQCQTWMYFHGAYQAKIQQQQQQQIQSSPSNESNQRTRLNQGPGMIMKLPSIRKRILASIIDYFFIHFFYDQFRMLIAEVWDHDIPFTSMDFKELESFFPEDDDSFEDLLPKIFWTYVKTIQYATLFYLFYLIYETMFLYGWPNRTYPGATIGKRILGLRVVSCDYLEQVLLANDNLVRVAPAGNITLVKAFLRTLVKLLPISNTIQSINILSSRYNRSYFDSRMGCLVVDVSAQAMAQAAAAAGAEPATGPNNQSLNILNNQGVANNLQQQNPNRGFWW